MQVASAVADDFDGWLSLAREVEPLFGPMVDDVAFQEALKQAICGGSAFCIRPSYNALQRTLRGGIIISREGNEIVWLAVSAACRRSGYGAALVRHAISLLDPRKSIVVQTFHRSILEGRAARNLYGRLGFMDHKAGGINPAGLPTVIMRRTGS